MTRLWFIVFAIFLPLAARSSNHTISDCHSGYVGIADGGVFPADEPVLETLRVQGDLAGQRRHLWQVFDALTRPRCAGNPPPFMTWYGAAETFSAPVPGGPQYPRSAFALPPPIKAGATQSGLPPLIIRTHYNSEAYGHIRTHALYRVAGLRALAAGAKRGAPPSVPAFPREAVVLKTAWWPVPRDGMAALPVWDAERNAPNPSGNNYPTWRRVIGVCGTDTPAENRQPINIEFLGTVNRGTRCVDIGNFYHVIVDTQLAIDVMKDPSARKVALMVLGRPLSAGDSLALVAVHVATRELTDWVWGTFWWHDAAGQGPYAALRPQSVTMPWNNYLMNVAFDADVPRESDGGPRIVYNPWFEARFPDGGNGSGVVSNCVSCHQRAAIESGTPFLVTRGRMDWHEQSARPGELRTSFLWSLALQAR